MTLDLFLFKLILIPVLIGSMILAGRRLGPVINGLLVGLPLTTGPISLILARQFGLEFAARAAVGNLAGQVSMCVFCLVYCLAAQKNSWWSSAFSAVGAFILATLLLNQISWQLWPAFFFLLVVIGLSASFIPRHVPAVQAAVTPRWDLPARMIVATLFVLLMTAFANILGPQLSGLISTFPIFGVIFATLTHSRQGAIAASNLVRGIILGSLSYAFFFLCVGISLTRSGIPLTYFMASTVAVSNSAIFISSPVQKKRLRTCERYRYDYCHSFPSPCKKRTIVLK